VVAADAFVDILQDDLAFFSWNAIHDFLGQVFVHGNLLLADVVDEGLSLVHIYHHDLLASWEKRWFSGRGCRLRDG
jgi:hypothetical protein